MDIGWMFVWVMVHEISWTFEEMGAGGKGRRDFF